RKLPNLHALTTVQTVPKAQRRNRAVPAFATLVLVLVLSMVYYVSTRQPSYTPPTQPSALSIAPITIPTPEPIAEPTAEPTPVKAEVKPSTAAERKPATKTRTASQTQRTSEPKKEDSKVNSILKKTGRILKKPFKKF
ncbi:MAG TPA: hypothetical protein VFU83_05535, partial [Pyrinomonadaceae bacterium]|nr:hypothetical protein [Pyrinomonadaceae bacterium]